MEDQTAREGVTERGAQREKKWINERRQQMCGQAEGKEVEVRTETGEDETSCREKKREMMEVMDRR